jgi:hypothetical protein
MNPVIVSLLLYAFVTSALLYWVTGHNLHKAFITFTMFAMCVVIWYSTDYLRGWPIEQVPKRGNLIGVVAKEPAGSYEGEIFLWVTVDDTFRTYVIPYTEGDAANAFEMNRVIDGGGRVTLEDEPGDGKERGELRYRLLVRIEPVK